MEDHGITSDRGLLGRGSVLVGMKYSRSAKLENTLDGATGY